MNHIERSIQLIQNLSTNEPYNLGFSGGKDSIVLLDLVKRSGVPFNPVYANTTMDPDGTIPFIRGNYTEVKIINPQKSFYQLIAEKGFPGRLRRWCCEELKEKYGIGKRNIEGMRREESQKRANYEPEQCDVRPWMKGACHVLPLVNWTEIQIWDYIHKNDLPYMKYYDPPYNFKRHGCIGCPLASRMQMRKEFQTFPKRAFAFMKAIERHFEAKPKSMISRTFLTKYEAFYFYVAGTTVAEFEQRKQALFRPDFKAMIEEYLKV